MDFFSACDQMGKLVEESIRDLAGTKEGGETVRMGADLTPTKKIDQVAEDCVLGYLTEHPLCSLLISEEAGKVAFDGERGTIFLTRWTGRSMLLPVSRFMPCPLRMPKAGIPRRRMSGTLRAARPSLRKRGALCAVTTSPSVFQRRATLTSVP